MLNSWMLADFSAVLAGRYELLWLVAVLGVLAYIAADRFTVAGLGEDVSTGLGLDHKTVVAAGMAIVAAVAAVVVVTVGALPLLGLVVPNVVSRLVGDDARRGLPLVALLGAVTVLICDMVGRSLPGLFAGGAPGAGEIPVGTIVGILGGAVFLAMMLRGVRNA
jgi:iron complex transport system permease protein